MGYGKTVFFGGISKSTPEKVIYAYFSVFGPIKQLFLDKRETKHHLRHHLPTTLHRGCGFVEFRVRSAANQAIG